MSVCATVRYLLGACDNNSAGIYTAYFGAIRRAVTCLLFLYHVVRQFVQSVDVPLSLFNTAILISSLNLKIMRSIELG